MPVWLCVVCRLVIVVFLDHTHYFGLLNFKYILGMTDIPDMFGVNSRCLVQAYVSRKQ